MRKMLDALRRATMLLPLDIRDYERHKKLMQEEQERKASKKQIGGNHYSKMTIQPVEFIEKNNLSYCQGNVIKYICRFDSKHASAEKQLQDLEKAKHYIEMLIDIHKKQ